jgi:hypothetical protein
VARDPSLNVGKVTLDSDLNVDSQPHRNPSHTRNVPLIECQVTPSPTSGPLTRVREW